MQEQLDRAVSLGLEVEVIRGFVEEENVPETDACSKSMESMINLDGANIGDRAETVAPQLVITA